MCLVWCKTKLVLLVFSSCAGQWLADPITFEVLRCAAPHRYYAHGCFCWQVYKANKLIVLDARRMEFSALNLPSPPGRYGQQVAIVEAGEGRLGMLTICDKIQSDAYHLFYAVQSTDGNGANQWQSKSLISLPENYDYCIMGVAGGYLLLCGYPEDNRPKVVYFSLNLQTFQVELFCQTDDYVLIGDLYADLPPSFSPPTL
ncbi:unnamed protein product [Triticum turgidum subsp. durum]|uniref:F-box associated domain-containing protein n=1 Tax=Triticum turgidum subsp. durum TaxID=4567 RepID=A0A9R0STR5_TRITD|nr:unnamed protein product [Triticum turgidum subsp. durum]